VTIAAQCRQRGADAAAAIARALVVAPHRAGGQTQFIEQPVPRAGRGDPMGGVLEHALAHLDDPALAHRAHMSRRTLDRQFRHAVMRPTAARRWAPTSALPARATSAAVVPCPRESRTAPRATAGSTPMARSTADGVSSPE